VQGAPPACFLKWTGFIFPTPDCWHLEDRRIL
jgi:hypothetical protein